MKSFMALNLQVAEASAAAMHDMPIAAAAKAIASRQAITFSFDVCIGLARARTHKSGSVRAARWMSALLRKRPNCCDAAKCRDGPNASLRTARKTATFLGVRPR